MKPGELRQWRVGEGAKLNEPFLVVDLHGEGTTRILDRGTIYTIDTRNIERFSEKVEDD
jgi:hypothetical protein